jgi:hypothetical protein
VVVPLYSISEKNIFKSLGQFFLGGGLKPNGVAGVVITTNQS